MRSKLAEMLRDSVSSWNEWRNQSQHGLLDLRRSQLSNVNLQGADLSYCDLSGSSMKGANLAGCIFRGTDLSHANLSGADLTGAALTRSTLARTRMIKSCAVKADFMCADLFLTDLRSADLSGADLQHSSLTFPNLSGTNFDGALFGFTSLIDVDLNKVKNLASSKHEWASNVGIRTLAYTYAKAGNKFDSEALSFFLAAGIPALLLQNFDMIQACPPI